MDYTVENEFIEPNKLFIASCGTITLTFLDTEEEYQIKDIYECKICVDNGINIQTLFAHPFLYVVAKEERKFSVKYVQPMFEGEGETIIGGSNTAKKNGVMEYSINEAIIWDDFDFDFQPNCSFLPQFHIRAADKKSSKAVLAFKK